MSEFFKKEFFGGIQSWVGWITLAVLLLSSLALGANRPVSWSILALLIMVVFVGQLIIDLWGEAPKNASRIWLPAFLVVGVALWGIAQTLTSLPDAWSHPNWQAIGGQNAVISADPASGWHMVMRLLCYAMIFWIAARACEIRSRAAVFVRAIAMFSTGLALYGLYAYFYGNNPILNIDRAPNISASFVNRNSYATYAAFGVLANLAAFSMITRESSSYGSASSRLRNFLESFFGGAWIYGLGIILCIGAVALTQSRAGGLSAIVGLFVFLVSSRSKGGGRNLVLPIAMVLILAFLLVTAFSGTIDRLMSTTGEEGRFAIYPLVVDGIMQRPLLGHGFGTFQESFRPLVPAAHASAEWNMAHNAYLENYFELGIPFATALYVALFLICWRIWRGSVTRRQNRTFPVLTLSCIAVAAVHSLFDFSLQMPATAALFAFILGMGWSHSFSRRNS